MPDISEGLTRAALAELIHWEELERSPQLAAFLSYIVEAKLRGDERSIKAYSIAVDVLGRPADFDPQSSPIVRVQGGRLRALVDRFYEEGHNTVPLRIRIPLGRYIPDFELLNTDPPAKPAAEHLPNFAPSGPAMRAAQFAQNAAIRLRRRIFYILGGFFLAVFVGWVIIGLGVLVPPAAQAPVVSAPGKLTYPSVEIAGFSNLTGDQQLDDPVASLGLELVANIARFRDIAVFRHDGEQRDAVHADFQLSGVVRRSSYGVEFNFFLIRTSNAEVEWVTAFNETPTTENYSKVVGDVASKVSSILGSRRGPVHEEMTRNVSASGFNDANLSSYRCRILLGFAQDAESGDKIDEARRCFEAVIERTPQDAVALAGWSGAVAISGIWGTLPSAGRNDPLMTALDRARLADERDPGSAFSELQLARVLRARGHFVDARQHYVTAIQLNPSDTDIRAEYGMMLAFSGEWHSGYAQMEIALRETVAAPPWYHLLRVIDAIQRKDYAAAQTIAAVASRRGGTLTILLAYIAAVHTDDRETISRLLPMISANPQFGEKGIVPVISQQVSDPELLVEIGRELLAAGLSPALVALTNG